MSFLGTLSLVEGQSRASHLRLVGRFVAAFTLSSFVIFGLAGAIGTATGRVVPDTVRVGVTCAVLAAALVLDGYGLRRKTWCPVTLRRQTPKGVLLRLGPDRAVVAWGLDTGLVFTTYRMSAISWALLLLGVVGAAPWWVGVGYAAGFAVPLALGLVLSPLLADPSESPPLGLFLARRTQLARAVCVTVLTAAVLLSVMSLTVALHPA